MDHAHQERYKIYLIQNNVQFQSKPIKVKSLVRKQVKMLSSYQLIKRIVVDAWIAHGKTKLQMRRAQSVYPNNKKSNALTVLQDKVKMVLSASSARKDGYRILRIRNNA